MLYKTLNNETVEWRGERINDVLHPFNIEQLWSDEQLNEIGLVRITDELVYNQTNSNIISAPSLGFGGPTGKELFNGNI